jgi:hypothetical protein
MRQDPLSVFKYTPRVQAALKDALEEVTAKRFPEEQFSFSQKEDDLLNALLHPDGNYLPSAPKPLTDVELDEIIDAATAEATQMTDAEKANERETVRKQIKIMKKLAQKFMVAGDQVSMHLTEDYIVQMKRLGDVYL